jgi:hypothetical protein
MNSEQEINAGYVIAMSRKAICGVLSSVEESGLTDLELYTSVLQGTFWALKSELPLADNEANERAENTASQVLFMGNGFESIIDTAVVYCLLEQVFTTMSGTQQNTDMVHFNHVLSERAGNIRKISSIFEKLMRSV